MQLSGAASPSVRRRLCLAAAGALVVPLGLAGRFLVGGWAGDLVGGILYAALVYLLVAFIAPRSLPRSVALLALAISCGVEFLQLTPLPRELAAVAPATRLVLGTTFASTDLLAYGAGALATWAVDQGIRRRHPVPGRAPAPSGR